MKLRLVCLGGAVALALLSLAVAGAQQVPPTPPPPISPNATQGPAVQLPVPATPQVSAAPTPTPGPRGRGRAPQSAPSPSASASETPAPPQFTTLDGIWEVEMQTRSKTLYSHWSLHQSGQAGADVSGIWNRGGKPPVNVSMSGTFDGRLFKFTATQGAKQYTFTGYVENYTDIVGMMTDGKTETAFTAEHRKKEKAINQINPGAIPLPGTPPR